ncbi:hypothetical protein [Xanthocytophaga flava]|uniref:hypothetical protein n=1 Tax=Xanthocytophaga flava TaxID=3048013 RepID=UPI0028D86246|nr:hypothetical protein [Xanthocytophaga flavus]
MESKISKGKIQLVVLFAADIILSFEIILASYFQDGHPNLISKIIRTAVAIFMMVLTYEGFRFAKWILTGMYLFGAVFLYNSQFANLDLFHKVFSMTFFFIAFYCFSAFYLQFSSSISEFLYNQSQKRKDS